MEAVPETIGVSRSQFHARATGMSKPRSRYRKAEDDDLLPALHRLVEERPTYGHRRIATLLNRERRAARLEPVNRKRVLRILNLHGLTLEQSTGRREGRVHGGKVAVVASNLRWCSDACEIACWNGQKVRVAFIIDAFDRAVIAHVAITRASISGSDVRDMMLAAIVLGLVPVWIDDYNTVHPHSALAMGSPAEFRSALNPSQTVR